MFAIATCNRSAQRHHSRAAAARCGELVNARCTGWRPASRAASYTKDGSASTRWLVAGSAMQFFAFLEDLSQQDLLLLEAVQQRDLAAVQQQLAAGANPSAADLGGLSALHVAAVTGQRDMVDALLAAGADVSATYHSATPLLYMAQESSNAMSSARMAGPLDGSDLSFISRYSRYWIGKAATPCQRDYCTHWCQQMAGVVQQLVAAGAQVDIAADADSNSSTPLHYAAEAGCPTLVATLLEAGADPGSSSSAGWTLLHDAVRSRKRQVVQQILAALGSSRAAELVRALGRSYKGTYRCAPLHTAAALGYPEIAEALVAAGADREQQNSEGSTPLVSALRCGHCHLVPLLVTPGNVNKRPDPESSSSRSSSTPLHLAVECLRATHSWQRWEGPPLADTTQAVAELLAAGADVHAPGHKGVTPLQAAAATGHPTILQMLLRHVLQQHKQQPRPQQQQRERQQQQQGKKEDAEEDDADTQLQMQLCHAALMALSTRGDLAHGTVWGDFWSQMLDSLGLQGVTDIWLNLQEMLQQPEEVTGLSEGLREALECHPPNTFGDRLRGAWVAAWTATCKENLQRTYTTQRLRQLFTLPQPPSSPSSQQQQHQQQPCRYPPQKGEQRQSHHRHQQQQQPLPWSPRQEEDKQQQQQHDGNGASAERPSKQSWLGRQIAQVLLREQRRVAAAATAAAAALVAAAGGSSGSSRASRAEARRVGAVIREVEAAAADGDEQRLQAALEQMPIRAAGLSAAAIAAGKVEQDGVYIDSLRELVMLDEGMAAAAVGQVQGHSCCFSGEALSNLVYGAVMYGDEGWEEACQHQVLEAALCAVAPVLADWGVIRQRRAEELRDAVLAAVTAALTS